MKIPAALILSACTLMWLASETSARAAEALQEAREAVRAGQQELLQAVQRHRQAEKEKRTTAAKIDAVRKQVEAKHEAETGFEAARKAMRAAHEEYDRVAALIHEKLKSQPEYQEAFKTAQAAAERRKALLEDESISPEERAKRLAEWNQLVLRPVTLEQAALEADPAAKAAREKLTKVEEAMAAARERLNTAVESDPALRDAIKAFERAKQDLAASERDQQGARLKIAAAEQRLVREEQQVQRKKLQSYRRRGRHRR